MPPVPRCQGGFTFLWLLFLVAGLGVSMAALGTLWHGVVQREKEAELLFVGDQYRRAIESFSQTMAPDGQKRLPKALEELLLDPRFPHTVRHLRRAYVDPVSGKPEWGLVKDGNGGIVGVHSLSEARPLKSAGFPERYATFATATRYLDWKFAYASSPVTAAGGTGASDGTPGAGAESHADARQDAQPRANFDACIKPHDAALAVCEAGKAPENMAAYYLCRQAAIDVFNACNASPP